MPSGTKKDQAMRAIRRIAVRHSQERHRLLSDQGIDAGHRQRVLDEMASAARERAIELARGYYAAVTAERQQLHSAWESPGKHSPSEFRRCLLEVDPLDDAGLDRYVEMAARAQDPVALRAAACVAARRVLGDPVVQLRPTGDLMVGDDARPQALVGPAKILRQYAQIVDPEWGAAVIAYGEHVREVKDTRFDFDVDSAASFAARPGDRPLEDDPSEPAAEPGPLPPLVPAKPVSALNGAQLLADALGALGAAEGAPAA